jgi:hypothetical protein
MQGKQLLHLPPPSLLPMHSAPFLLNEFFSLTAMVCTITSSTAVALPFRGASEGNGRPLPQPHAHSCRPSYTCTVQWQ